MTTTTKARARHIFTFQKDGKQETRSRVLSAEAANEFAAGLRRNGATDLTLRLEWIRPGADARNRKR